jgi:hypothetical protein
VLGKPVGALRGPGGQIKPSQIAVAPAVWHLPTEPGRPPTLDRLAPEACVVEYEVAQPFLLTVTIPPDAQPGAYQGRLVFRAMRRESVGLKLEVEVTAPSS